jgi:hypothetical protein
MRVAKAMVSDAQTEREPRALSQRECIEVRLQQRACIVLRAAKGTQNEDIAVGGTGLSRSAAALVRRGAGRGGPRDGRERLACVEKV